MGLSAGTIEARSATAAGTAVAGPRLVIVELTYPSVLARAPRASHRRRPLAAHSSILGNAMAIYDHFVRAIVHGPPSPAHHGRKGIGR
jgi:hypothetical protein